MEDSTRLFANWSKQRFCCNGLNVFSKCRRSISGVISLKKKKKKKKIKWILLETIVSFRSKKLCF